MRRILPVCIIVILLPLEVGAQYNSFNVSAELKSVAATNGDLPFWLYANRWGEVDPAGPNAILNTKLTRQFFKESTLWNAELGAELTTRYSTNSAAFFKQLYAKVNYRFFQLEAGRFKDITGNIYEPLSMGSMSFSGNATPLPKVKIGIPEYQSLPLTKGFIKIRGVWGHGWMGDARYTNNTYLIEQYGYARIGGDLPVNLIGGIHHFAFWGGKSPDFGRMPRSLKDFLNVAFALGNVADNVPDAEQEYFLGDHKGYWDFGMEIDWQPVKISLYKQFILEDKDNVKLKSPQDGLYGVSIEKVKGNSLIDHILWEFLYTKWQNGPVKDVGEEGRGGVGGRDNYYNHYIYKSGWTYFGNTIGTPLLYPRSSKPGIANNRVVAHHLGIGGQFSPLEEYRLIFTYSRNYGTYDHPIDPRLDSYSLLASSRYKPESWKNLSLQASLGVDLGELHGQNVGLMLGISWSPR